jgi:hypothetical protein
MVDDLGLHSSGSSHPSLTPRSISLIRDRPPTGVTAGRVIPMPDVHPIR